MAVLKAGGKDTFRIVSATREVPADGETPVTLFGRLGDREGAFLLESVPTAGPSRYSFFGTSPLVRLEVRRGFATFSGLLEERRFRASVPAALRFLLATLQVEAKNTTPFPGGAVGFMAYDAVRELEDIGPGPDDERDLPDALFVVPRLLYTFDHSRRTLTATVFAAEGTPKADLEAELQRALALPQAPLPENDGKAPPAQGTFTPSRAAYVAAVERARQAIVDGEIFQVVLSTRFSTPLTVPPFALYRALRKINPSPYLFYLNFGRTKIIGASPESLVTVRGRKVLVRPIAGTRGRGRTEEEDRLLAAELIADGKERAEHVMLVDLARNDVGRVSEVGTVSVTSFMEIERYSHVMHIVSAVEGVLAPERDALDALAAAFPAGTLTGAPKIRAMEIIDEMEGVRRGPYGGAVGYLTSAGDLDLAIAIRTFVVHDETLYVQAGAGIVADSDPESEWQECQRKARVLIEALAKAGGEA